MKSTTVILALLLVAGPALADQWDDHTRTGEWAFATGNFERAEQEFRSALTIAQGLPPGSRRLETSLENLARFFEHRSRFDEAQPMYQLLLAAREHRVGTEAPELLDTVLAVARICLSRGEVPTADENLRRYVAIADEAGRSGGELARVLALLARSLALQERGEEALPLQHRAVSLFRAERGVDDVEVANAMESLAQLELLHGTPDTAKDLLLEAVERRRAAGEIADPSATLAAAAATAFAGGNFDAAEELAEMAISAGGGAELDARRVLANVSWMRVRRSSVELADLVGAAAGDPRIDTARERLTTLLALLEDADPSAREDILETRKRLVSVGAMGGDLERAISEQERIVGTAVTPQMRLKARNSMVSLLVAARRTADAAAANSSVISEVEDAFGPESAQLLPPLHLQLELLTELKERKQARALKKRIKKLNKALRKR